MSIIYSKALLFLLPISDCTVRSCGVVCPLLGTLLTLTLPPLPLRFVYTSFSSSPARQPRPLCTDGNTCALTLGLFLSRLITDEGLDAQQLAQPTDHPPPPFPFPPSTAPTPPPPVTCDTSGRTGQHRTAPKHLIEILLSIDQLQLEQPPLLLHLLALLLLMQLQYSSSSRMRSTSSLRASRRVPALLEAELRLNEPVGLFECVMLVGDELLDGGGMWVIVREPSSCGVLL